MKYAHFSLFLASEREASVSTHQVSLSAIFFLYQCVLGVDLEWLVGLERPSAPNSNAISRVAFRPFMLQEARQMDTS